eukprot:CAMPEP_0202916432 /NCGR_PEP_ID=MMETSP1392-20130828/68578_1 /ASSEMBLY_ACC=CAM_ASM_000868 /TAXON_ID=225041 /ORGANISM="Chlamydomonas chlamydogama, Strain SAG 11-48b" /LENGTH=46 /DNA_ID= /DNA_START= /DNA_END= /DNA_ORIENTATION=
MTALLSLLATSAGLCGSSTRLAAVKPTDATEDDDTLGLDTEAVLTS